MNRLLTLTATIKLLTVSLWSNAVVIEILDDSYLLKVTYDTYYYGSYTSETQARKSVKGNFFDYSTGGISDLPKSLSAGPQDYASVSINGYSTGYSTNSFIPYVFSGGWDSCYWGNSDGELCHTGSAHASFRLTLRPLDGSALFYPYDHHKSSSRVIIDQESGEKVREILPGRTYDLYVSSSQQRHGSSRSAGLEANGPVEWRVVSTPTAVPEPAAWALMAIGLFGGFLARLGNRG